MPASVFALGVDFGTDSVRCLLFDLAERKVVDQAAKPFVRWAAGEFCQPALQQYRQHPQDHLEAMEAAINAITSKLSPQEKLSVSSLGIDATGSTPIAVDHAGQPLCFQDDFRDDPDLLFWLWKDHTAEAEAAEINEKAATFSENYLHAIGGVYSSEWLWAKALRLLRSRPELHGAIHSFVEHSDWLPFVLTGGHQLQQLKRNVCAAGHKGLWQHAANALPPEAFFTAIDPMLAPVAATFGNFCTAVEPVDNLCEAWAARLGLHTGVVVSAGAIDAHVGAIGAGVKPGLLCKVMGTSTCDMMVVREEDLSAPVKGINGQVMGSILPGYFGLEAGQAAFGDAYAWVGKTLLWAQEADALNAAVGAASSLLPRLEKAALELDWNEDSPLALDWFNGRRSPGLNNRLKGGFAQLNLSSSAPALYRAVVEATCFGSLAILQAVQQSGVAIERVVALGGIAQKSPLVMQTLANVLNMPVEVCSNDQACALGALLLGATAAGHFARLEDAMAACVPDNSLVYWPDPKVAALARSRYLLYQMQASASEAMANHGLERIFC